MTTPRLRVLAGVALLAACSGTPDGIEVTLRKAFRDNDQQQHPVSLVSTTMDHELRVALGVCAYDSTVTYTPQADMGAHLTADALIADCVLGAPGSYAGLTTQTHTTVETTLLGAALRPSH